MTPAARCRKTKITPATSASLVSLANAGFYDETIFHRIVPGFVIQGGDPTQTGSGGPGYQTVDVPASDAAYTKGVVAMAKTSTEAPGTSGSQFFVVSGDDVALPLGSPAYLDPSLTLPLSAVGEGLFRAKEEMGKSQREYFLREQLRAIQSELGIPVKLVGLGEGIEDLVEFDPREFVDALFSA